MDDKKFVFDSYYIDKESGELIFSYKYTGGMESDIDFSEKLILPNAHNIDTIPEALMQGLHLVIGISYYKLYCPRTILINGYSLTKQQAEFWNTVYTKGLGEFFYKNKVDFRGRIQFPYAENGDTQNEDAQSEFVLAKELVGEKALVTIGGGKDSIVSLEITRETGIEFDLFSLNSYPVLDEVAQTAHAKLQSIIRKIDPLLDKYNSKKGALNGHIPISAIYAFTSLLFAYVNGFRYIVYSNERSSNFGNAEYLGMEVSHQWSKSREFEDLFRAYVSDNITKDIEYFSLLRPFYEISIAKIFTYYPQYFDVFTSSNHTFKLHQANQQRWDYSSPKTLFVFCLLAAFLPKNDIVKIFGLDLYANDQTSDVFRELLGFKDIKPFDCVGTPEETQVAFYKAFLSGDYQDDPIMKMFEKEILPKIKDVLDTHMKEVFSYDDDSNIPEKFKKQLVRHLR